MKIRYQGKETETDADTAAAFLAAQGVDAAEAVVELDGEIVAEYKGEILSGSAALAAQLEQGAELNAFRIVAGG